MCYIGSARTIEATKRDCNCIKTGHTGILGSLWLSSKVISYYNAGQSLFRRTTRHNHYCDGKIGERGENITVKKYSLIDCGTRILSRNVFTLYLKLIYSVIWVITSMFSVSCRYYFLRNCNFAFNTLGTYLIVNETRLDLVNVSPSSAWQKWIFLMWWSSVSWVNRSIPWR